MVCLWKWGHHWQEPKPQLRSNIIKSLKLFGIYPKTVQVCSKCDKVLLTASTILDESLRTIIMRPFPRASCEFSKKCNDFDPKSDACTKFGGAFVFSDAPGCGTWRELKEKQERG